jgi:predicted negative regulator of RcsB-dependent stress response
MDKREERKQHEEELEQNDLYVFLTNFRRFWDKHGTSVLLVILVAVLLVVGIPWLRGRTEAKREAAGSALTSAAAAETGRAEALAAVAMEYEDQPGVANLALLRAGDEKLKAALGLAPEADTPDATRPDLSDSVLEQLDDAAAFYQRVIDNAQTDAAPTIIALNARLGLADVHASKGEFEEARQQIQAVRDAAAGRFPALVARADIRLRRLDDYNLNIAFPSRPQTAEVMEQIEVGDPDELNRMIEEAEALVPATTPETPQTPEQTPVQPQDQPEDVGSVNEPADQAPETPQPDEATQETTPSAEATDED